MGMVHAWIPFRRMYLYVNWDVSLWTFLQVWNIGFHSSSHSWHETWSVCGLFREMYCERFAVLTRRWPYFKFPRPRPFWPSVHETLFGRHTPYLRDCKEWSIRCIQTEHTRWLYGIRLSKRLTPFPMYGLIRIRIILPSSLHESVYSKYRNCDTLGRLPQKHVTAQFIGVHASNTVSERLLFLCSSQWLLRWLQTSLGRSLITASSN